MLTKINKKKILIYFVIISIVLPLSPILQILAINGNVFTLIISIISLFFLVGRDNGFQLSFFSFSLLFISFFFSFILAIYWVDLNYLQLPLLFIFSILISSKLDELQVLLLSKWLILVACAIALGSIFQFFYALSGGSPISTFIMGDGRELFIFPGGFTNVVLGNITRPSAIFDEPGTFAIFISFTLILSELVDSENYFKSKIFLIFAGLLTFSIAFFLFLLLYMVHKKQIKLASFLFLFISILLSLLNPQVVELLLYSRFEIEDGGLKGDNRTAQFIDSLNILTHKVAIFGLDPTCLFNRVECYDRFGYLGENPLSPLMFGGLLYSFSFYFSLIIFIYLSVVFKKFRYLFIAMIMLYLQRPYGLISGYSMMFFLVLFTGLKTKQVFNKRCLN